MTGKLIYVSEEEFEQDYLLALHEEAEELARERVWWNEPIKLYESEETPYLLTGSNKLLRRYLSHGQGAPRNIDYRDDILMSIVDYFAAVEILTILSKEHEFAWQISQPSEPRDKLIGRIVNGEIEPRVFEFLLPEMDALRISEEELEDLALHERIRAKYFGAPVP